MSYKQAMINLRDVMLKDPSFAWAWHCFLAAMAEDAGAPRKEANIGAADLMQYLFGVNTSEYIPDD